VSSVLVGATKPEQLTDNLKTVEWSLTEDEVDRLNKASAPAPYYPKWMLEFTRNDRADPEFFL
jgi:aryl-alcohol dehydrogenase-like predicted oxidoreductase